MTDALKQLAEKAGDVTAATAMEVAERKLEKSGWRYNDEDIGRSAAKIINAMNAALIAEGEKK